MGEEVVASTLDSADAAFERGEFDVARDLYEAAVAEEASAEALDGLGQALWFLGEIDDGIARREEAYASFRRSGELARAADIALWLVVEQATSLGNETAAAGWFNRAERLLAETPLCRAHAELEVQRGLRRSDPGQAEDHFEHAVEIGKQLADPAAEVRGLNQLGFLKVMQGDLEGGMALLDETMAAAMGGELKDPWAVGATCCSVLFACERISDLQRAAQWCRVVVDFTERRRYVPLSALCRSVYAGVLISSGEWDRAERELRDALDAYRGFGRPLAAYPLARLANLRLRQGRVEEAEQLITGWEGHPEMTTIAIALLIERGETALACTKLEHHLERIGEPAAVPLLPLLVGARLAEGDHDGARASAEQFMGVAERLRHRHLLALAEVAVGQVIAATDAEPAVGHFEAGIETFSRLGMPFEEGVAHVQLARALASREPQLAAAEGRTALQLFERLGAAQEADRAAFLLRSLGAAGRSSPKRPGELTKREREVLALLEHGLSNKEIAARLYITPKTASHHVSRILSKLGVRTRAEAAAFAARESADKSAVK